MPDWLRKILRPARCYQLCSVSRAGAHLLSDGLRATRLAGRPQRYFSEGLEQESAARYGFDSARDYAAYVRGMVTAAATKNGVFGFRIESWEMERFIGRLRATGEFGPPEASEVKILRRAFPGLRFILLTRQDKLRQAISRARAMQTNVWVSGRNQSATGEAVFDPAFIRECQLSALRAEKIWCDFFKRNAIDPLAITYEDLCADYAGTVARVLDYLQIRLPRDQRHRNSENRSAGGRDHRRLGEALRGAESPGTDRALVAQLDVPVGEVDEMPPAFMLLAAESQVHERPPLRPLRFADQRHVHLMRQPVALAGIAGNAGADDVFPGR